MRISSKHCFLITLVILSCRLECGLTAAAGVPATDDDGNEGGGVEVPLGAALGTALGGKVLVLARAPWSLAASAMLSFI